MVVLIFTRFINVRNALNINHFGAAGNILNAVQHSNVISKSYSTNTTTNNKTDNEFLNKYGNSGERKMSKAMKIYLQKSEDYKMFIEKQITMYNIGKRHLANMMGEDPENFDQKHMDNAIEYLFPSGLYDKEAHPSMKHPTILYTNQKEAAFAESGRPHHFLFYTIKPNYYEVLYRIVESINRLNMIEDEMIRMKVKINPEDKVNISSSAWLTKEELEKKLLEELSLSQYEYFITSMERIVNHPISKNVESFIMEYRKILTNIIQHIQTEELEYDSDNRPFIVSKCARKKSRGEVKVIGNGTGNITINGKDITYFNDIQHREQVSF
ncbi:hypothetical protein ANTPLA_LOCUS10484 [Anthophora plagiata]